MRSYYQLLSEAEAAERLAALVTYARDKEQLLEQAKRLRRQARIVGERSWAPPEESPGDDQRH